MNCKRSAVGTSLIFVLGIVLGSAPRMRAQDAKAPYPSMAPLDQYLMDRNAEIALARSAAPESISRDATIMVLGRRNYETAVEGKNGFVCIVERAWTSPFDSTEYWNPKNRSPICYNPPAARSILPITSMRTELVLEGLSKEQIRERAKAAVDRKEIPPVEPGAMCYMMGKGGYLSDNGLTADGAHNMAHLMFFTPPIDPAEWGANMDKSPVVLDPRHKSDPEPNNVFMVLTGTWSDGTPAPLN